MDSSEGPANGSDKTIREQRQEKNGAEITELRVGARLGPFRIEELLGEGGMGTVFLAEQLEPVRRKVAVKVLQQQLLEPGHIARFAVEQQAMARMSHPAIAQVYDAGTTPEGRPYFAMEYVPGEPITKFCRARGLGLRRRLELFVKVCWGVQHAHQKGLIHRDLKPSNILVAEVDRQPSPKIIDFGIATAAGAAGKGRAQSSQPRGFVGTPQYMSPEQVELAKSDLDTRSDIYSLGAVLYELLTGRTPLGVPDLSETTREELQRLLHETEVPSPSRQLQHGDGDLPGVAASPGARRRLLQDLSSEVDWIVLKALALDRTQRYPTAAALAQDVEAFLGGSIVAAVPPSRAYRWRTTARRHKALLTAATAVTAALLVGLTLATWSFLEARAQRDRALEAEAVARVEAAKSQKVAAFTQEMLTGVNPEVAGTLDKTLLRKILEGAAAKVDTELADQPEVAAAIHGTIAQTYSSLAEYPPALEHFAAALKLLERTVGRDHLESLRILARLGEIRTIQGDYKTGEELLREATTKLKATVGDEHDATLTAVKLLADLYRSQGRFDEAEPLYEQVVAIRRRTKGQEDGDTLYALNALGSLYVRQGRKDEAVAVLQNIADISPRVMGPDHPMTINAYANLATALVEAERYQEAEHLYHQAVDASRRVLGPDHHITLTYISNLASLLERQGRFDAAEPLYIEVLATRRRLLGPEFPNYSESMTLLNNLGGLYRKLGRYDEGSKLLSEAVGAAKATLPADHWMTAILLSNHAAILIEMSSFAAAEKALLEARGIYERSVGLDHERAVLNEERLTDLRRRWRK